MAKKSVIELPNGSRIEVSPDLSPEQITAMVTAASGAPTPPEGASKPMEEETESGEVYVEEPTIHDIWESSKKERVALFVRAYMSENLWFSSKDIMDQQIAELGSVELGESSAIGTYLHRLFEAGYLDKKKSQTGRNVYYRIGEKLVDEYPQVKPEQIRVLIRNK